MTSDIHLSCKNNFRPFLRGAAPEHLRDARVVPFNPEVRRPFHIGTIQTTELIYQRWRAGILYLVSDYPQQVLLEVELKAQFKTFFYHYPIDIKFLFSPEWRRDNLSSPSGFFRWSIEMDVALSLNVVREFQGIRLGNKRSIKQLNKTGRINDLEGDTCSSYDFHRSSNRLLILNTAMFHCLSIGKIGELTDQNKRNELARCNEISRIGMLADLENLGLPNGRKNMNPVKYKRANQPMAKVAFPAEMVSLIAELEKNWQEYVGITNRVKLAEKIGISIRQLNFALSLLTDSSGRSLKEILEYKRIASPRIRSRHRGRSPILSVISEELSENWIEYVGNRNQLKLARKVGTKNLYNLFYYLSKLVGPGGRSWAKILGYRNLAVPCAKVADFYDEYLAFIENNGVFYKLTSELQKTSPADCKTKFEKIRDNFFSLKTFIEAHRREDWPKSFYQYLLQTLPFISFPENAAIVARRIIDYLEQNMERIEKIINNIPEQSLSYEVLHDHFGEYTIPVIKFNGGLRWIGPKRRGSLRERLAFDLPIAGIGQIGVDYFMDKNALSPLEALLLKEERQQFEALMKELSPSERVLVQEYMDSEDDQPISPELEEIFKKLREV